jgi:hypothetical protein
MGRLLLAGTLVCIAMGIAHAAPTRKVQIETEPPGAAVYLNDVDNGAACDSTPCTIDAPIGVQTIIIRLDKYEPEIKELDVPKGKRPLQQKYKLKGAIATIKVDMPKGAIVRVDEEEKGKAPVEVPISAGEGHHVSVTLNGKSVFDDFVEVATGDEYVVKPKAGAGGSTTTTTASNDTDNATVTDDKDNENDGSGGGGGGGSGSSEITGHSSEPRSVYLTGGVAFDIGFRHFSYEQRMTNNLRSESEGGQVMLGPALELWPGRMAGVHVLRGLSLFARFQFPVAGQTVTQQMGNDLMGTVKTKWSSYEVSLRQRWVFGGFGVEASGGFDDDRYSFDVTYGQDILLMPDTNYQSVRLGGKLAYMSGGVEPYISAENRIVLSGGPVGDRFATAKASGLKATAGLVLEVGKFSARAEGALINYSWDFTYDPSGTSKATGATDSIKLISMLVGYSY